MLKKDRVSVYTDHLEPNGKVFPSMIQERMINQVGGASDLVMFPFKAGGGAPGPPGGKEF
jgi:hypothetical protein